MLVAAGGGDAAECQQPNELPVSDNNSGNSTPRQRRKRRSAAERRESHRRRSAAVVNEAVHLANQLNGLPQHKQKHENDGENEPIFAKPFSPIPDHSETGNDEIGFNEPPEPSVHAPGDEREGEEVSDLFSQQFNGELMMEKIGCRRAEATTSDNLMSNDVLLQSSFEHRRSISADHLLHGIGLRREMLLLEADQSDLADAIHIKMQSTFASGSDSNNKKFWREEGEGEEEEQTEAEGVACGQKKQFMQPNLSHSPSIANKRPPVSRKSPLLAQIQKQQQNSVNYNDPTCSPFSPSSKARCASSTTKSKENRKEEVPAAEAGSLSGPEQSFQSGGSDTSKWEKEINKSSESHEQQLHQERKKKGNCKRRNSSVSTVSAPCTHSIPTTSNVLLNLVDRFVSKRQYSDSNLLTSAGNKPTFGESFGRRSFKWNLFWGRKEGNNEKRKEEAVVVDDHRSSRRKSGDEEEIRGYRKKCCDQRKTSSRLGTLMEDLETGEDKERKKKQFAEEIHLENDKKRFEAALQLPVHNEHHLVRIRVNRSMEVEDKKSCHVDGSTMKGSNDLTSQRFSLIGSCDLAKLEEAIELKTNGVRRATSLREKYRIRQEDSHKLELFLKERGMRRREEEEESDENAEGEMNLEHFMLLRCSRPNPFSAIPISTEHFQQQAPHHSTKNLKKAISPQLNTAPLTMPRKKSYNLPRKSSINVHHFGTLKRKKGIANAQLARRRSSYVTKAQVLMARNKIQKDEEMKEDKTTEDHGTGEKRATEVSDRGKESETINPEVVVIRREKADMLTKQRGASVSSSSLRQFLVGSERKGSRGSKVAPKTNSTKGASLIVVEKDRAERSKKRESKTNSAALLGTIWSIRPRRKKENNRSLANLFSQQNEQTFVASEERTNADGLPDVSANSSTRKHTTAQSPSSTAFSFDQIPDLASVLSPAIFTRSQLNNPRWDDLGIWDEEEPSWTAKFPTEAQKLDNTERKRQNIIYELMMTEKNHCQVLVLLRQVYQEGLIRNGILDKATVKKLVPDVLDILLDFHLNLLRRFRTRMEATIVRDISDIICDGFGDSPIRSATIQSYTAFCLSREHSYHLLAALIAQKAIVRKFFEFHESEYKDRSFKACMLLIAQRLTKYPILIEQILKYESLADQKIKMQKAHFAVKSFALEINDELLRYERKIQWEAVKKALEKSSTGKLIDPKSKQDFTYADLVEPVEEANSEHEWGRKVHLVQRVFWRETMTSPDVELRLLLCDDIIVFLRPKGASIGSGGTASGTGLDKKELPLQFFRHNSHSGVLPLYNTLVKGENLRRKSLLLIVTDREQPDLIQLVFPSSPEMEQCVHAIKLAKTNAPKFVRLSKRRVFELSQRSIGEGTSAAEKEYQSKMDAWQRELEGIFATYSEDSVLVDYFEYRMTFFDTIRAHLCRCPFRHFTAGEEQQHKRNSDREKERLSVLLKAKFVELARKRNGALAHLVERAQRARDADLPSFFDDLYDLGVAGSTPLQSSSSSDEHFNQAIGSSDSCENQTKMPEGGGKKKPRRVCTYHGHGSTEQKNLSSSSASSAGGVHPIRRHTTVPAGGHHVGSSDEEDVEVDSEIRRLPLKMNPMSRKAATEIIRDNIRLRSQNDRLKKESALKDLQLVSLRSRRGPSGETPERLESLRQKQEELQAEKREFLTECERREGQFRAKCAGREEHLQRLEDELRGRAEEFVRMKEELERLTMQKREEATEESAAKCQQTPNSPTRTPTKAMNAVMRINNTYCGAGPVPRPSTEQQLQHEQLGACSFRLPTPQLLDRRAVSQMELPRHLVVKTETKQADKVRKMRKN